MAAADKIAFRVIEETDLPAMLAIYNYYVDHTTITFHTEPVTPDQFRASVKHANPRYQTFVIEENGTLSGYMLLTQHKNKQAYDVTAEVSIYLDPNGLGRGVGGLALAFLEEAGRGAGFHGLVATVCTENERSIALFERRGFEKCAHFKQVGCKFGRWLDIASYQKIFQ